MNDSTRKQLLHELAARGYRADGSSPFRSIQFDLDEFSEVELGEQNDVRTTAFHELERLAPPCRPEHVEPVVAELPSEILACLRLGLGDEDGARHGATLAAACGPSATAISSGRTAAGRSVRTATSLGGQPVTSILHCVTTCQPRLDKSR